MLCTCLNSKLDDNKKLNVIEHGLMPIDDIDHDITCTSIVLK